MCSMLCCVRLFTTPWTVACQAPLPMGFSRQEYWNGLPFPTPEDILDPGIELESLALVGRFFTGVAWDVFVITLPNPQRVSPRQQCSQPPHFVSSFRQCGKAAAFSAVNWGRAGGQERSPVINSVSSQQGPLAHRKAGLCHEKTLKSSIFQQEDK